MKVIKIDKKRKKALAEVQGVKREISTMLLTEKLKVGDYVAVHVGYALEIMDVKTAREILEVLGDGSGINRK
jgi:hydrogenase expression/formation protein HypC